MTKGALNEHLRIHRNEKSFRCEDCGKYFRHKHGLVTHQRKRKYPCDVRKYGEKKFRKSNKGQQYNKLKANKKNNHTGYMNEVAPITDDPKNKKLKANKQQSNIRYKDEIVFKVDDSKNSKPKQNEDCYYRRKFTQTNEQNQLTSVSVDPVSPIIRIEREILSPDTNIDGPFTEIDSKEEGVPNNVSCVFNERNSEIKSYRFGFDDKTQRFQTVRTTALPCLRTGNALCSKYLEDKFLLSTLPTKQLEVQSGEVTNKDGLIAESAYSFYAENNNASIAKAKQRSLANENPYQPDNKKILKQSYHNLPFIVKRHKEMVQGLEQDTVCPKKQNSQMLGTKQFIGHINRHAITGKRYAGEQSEMISFHQNIYVHSDGPSGTSVNIVPSVTIKLNQVIENENVYSPGLFFDQQTETSEANNESSPDNAVRSDVVNKTTDICPSNPVMKQKTEIPLKSYAKCGEREAILERNNAQKSDRKLSKQTAVIEMNEEEILKVIEKARCKEFKCGYCTRTFVNEYCLSVHACKAGNGNLSGRQYKVNHERKYCERCHKSYSNKYLLAGHSCKPNTTNKKQKHVCKEKGKKQISNALMHSDKTDNSKGTAIGSNVDESSNVPDDEIRKSKRNKRKDKNSMMNTQCHSNKIDRTSENVSPKNVSGMNNNKKSTESNVIDVKSVTDKIVNIDDRSVETVTSKQAKDALICEICGKVYKNRTNLKNHSCKPPSEETRTCKICRKTFNLKVHLQIHMRIHTN